MQIPEGQSREIPEEGTYPVRCCSFVDLGTQPANREGWEDQRVAAIGFQLIGEKGSENQNMCVYGNFTIPKSYKSKRAKMIKLMHAMNLDPAETDTLDLINGACMLEVKHGGDDGQYANIGEVTKPSKSTKIGKLTEKTTYFSLDPDEFDEEVFNELPQFLKEKIMGSDEYEEALTGATKKKKKPVSEKTPVKKKPAKKAAKKRR